MFIQQGVFQFDPFTYFQPTNLPTYQPTPVDWADELSPGMGGKKAKKALVDSLIQTPQFVWYILDVAPTPQCNWIVFHPQTNTPLKTRLFFHQANDFKFFTTLRISDWTLQKRGVLYHVFRRVLLDLQFPPVTWDPMILRVVYLPTFSKKIAQM